MPSPAAHTIIGVSFGAAWFAPAARSWRGALLGVARQWRPIAFCVVLSCAPDIDYAFGMPEGDFNRYHQLYSHTFGWVFAVAVVTYAFWKHYDPSVTWRFFLFLLALAVSHLAADMLTDDGSYPYGIMALWPFYKERLISPLSLFPRWAKKNWRSVADVKNFWPLGVELIVTLPLLALVLLYKRFAPTGRSGSRTSH